jgi:hypothetical protein
MKKGLNEQLTHNLQMEVIAAPTRIRSITREQHVSHRTAINQSLRLQ